MGAKGIVIAEECHVVNILPPQDVQAGVSSDVFSMKDHSHCTIIVQAGSTDADAGNVTVEQCDDFTPTTHPDLASFAYYAETTAAGDTLAARASGAAIDVSANDNVMYVIEIDAAELTVGTYSKLRISWSACGGATLGSAVAILSGSRYAGDTNATEIA